MEMTGLTTNTLRSLIVLAIGAGVWLAPRQVDPTTTAPAMRYERPGTPVRCTSLIVGRDATTDGSVLLAHNEDLGDHAAQHYVVVEAADHAPGATETLFGGTVVPLPEHTHGYVASTLFDLAYIPGDVTGGINDQGLMVANNLAYRKDAPAWPPIDGKVLWSEFTRLALARAATAREAVTVVGGLVEDHGLGLDSGTMIGVADAGEGWWIEITLEGQWVAQRVADDGFSVRANTFRIGVVDLEDTDNFLGSPDLVQHAIGQGWYTQGPFDFAQVYGDPYALGASWNTHRQERLDNQLSALAPNVAPQDVTALLRDHYEGTAWDETDGYTLGPPHQTGEYCVCDMTTEVSLVCQSRDWLPVDVGGVCWRAMATPCSSVYVPWYAGHTEIPEAYQRGVAVQTENSAYWAFRELSEAVEPRYAEVIEDLRGFWSAIEVLEASELAAVETEAADQWTDDPDAARAMLTESSNAWAELVHDYALELLANDLDVDALELPAATDDDDSSEPADDDDDSAGPGDDDDSADPGDDDDDDDATPPGGGGGDDDGGCSCRQPGHTATPAAALLGAAAAIVGWRRRP
jgi:dipeptidase